MSRFRTTLSIGLLVDDDTIGTAYAPEVQDGEVFSPGSRGLVKAVCSTRTRGIRRMKTADANGAHAKQCVATRFLPMMRLGTSALVFCLLAGCATLGPRSIQAGRVAYAEAINRTQDEQILLSIVKGRYGESTTLLAVNGVIASLRFRAEVGIEAGFRGAGSPGDDLLPAGVAYEENPTISYAPVQGEDYVRQLMSPVPLDLLLMIMRSSSQSTQAWSLLVDRVNSIRNPVFVREPASQPDTRFARLAELLSELGDSGALELVQTEEKGAAFSIWLDPRTEKDATRVAEVLDLLELPRRADDPKPVAIPAFLGIRADEGWGVGITTRSTFNLVEVMKAAVEVPGDHAAAGLTETYPPLGPVGEGIRIQSSEHRPADQSLAVRYRGYWFWIDDTDRRTKSVFRLLRTLWSISIASSEGQASAPVLTLPVGN